MCCSVRVNDNVLHIATAMRQWFPSTPFGGFLRKENLEYWTPRIVGKYEIPVDGFGERSRTGNGSVKHFRRPGKLVIFKVENHGRVETRILTKVASEEVARVHNREPCIVPCATRDSTD